MARRGKDSNDAGIRYDDGRISLHGDLTVKTARRLFDQSPKFAAGEMRMDLASVGEADSAGLALLVHWVNLAGASSARLTFAGAPAQLREMAKIAGLETLFDS